jgi:hypothetical protein
MVVWRFAARASVVIGQHQSDDMVSELVSNVVLALT